MTSGDRNFHRRGAEFTPRLAEKTVQLSARLGGSAPRLRR
ncbi:hypothetical protein BH18ACI2_BH18ACI2_03660 [soil metagenome]